jgi:hypothetical protein
MKTESARHRTGTRIALASLFLASLSSRGAEVSTLPSNSPAQAQIAERFQKEIYPLLARESDRQESCVGCHDVESRSSLVFLGEPGDDFEMLLENGYLALRGPDTLLGRVTSVNHQKRMPKGKAAEPWTSDEIERLKAFLVEVNARAESGERTDERFPASLLRPYKSQAPESRDNQFITYRQLRGKIKVIFDDDWVRDGKDLFQDNVAMFGGADFKERFDESAQASSAFLTALEMLAKDVSSQAYTRKLGPFAADLYDLPSPLTMDEPDAVYRRAITNLYGAILFRSPSAAELRDSFVLLKSIHREQAVIESGDYELGFELAVVDPSTGLESRRSLVIPVSGDAGGVYQELIDQSAHREPDEGTSKARQRLARPLRLEAGSGSHRFVIHNAQTVGNVSFAGLELRQPGTDQILQIHAKDTAVRADGAWKVRQNDGFLSYEDDQLEKGNASITVPLRVPETGDYEVTVLWRGNSNNAANVLTEVFCAGAIELARPPLANVPEAGIARFTYDSSEDTTPFADLGASFVFGEEDYVEINNAGTLNRVAAGAIDFVPVQGDGAFVIDSKEADGSDQWTPFSSGQFGAYNQKGTQLQDENQNKGERYLRYRPSLKKDAEKPWKPDRAYQVHIHYPAKSANESRVPVVVKARQSSPIVQIAYPARAKADARVEIDAFASYTAQHSKLSYSWKQTKGFAVKLRPEGARLSFVAPRRRVEQVAWEALARALIRHPDFLFTRPPALRHATDTQEKKRLQLVKIALDLAGRAPTREELRRLDEGASLGKMVDHFLESQEFRDFYFHRVRLYLESQGTETQDEPARLWCYVAFNDLPFQQILTADYTVDADGKKQARPAYHGRSGLLTTKGFIEGKPGLPHFNYAAQVSMLFLGYVYEVPPEIVEQREGITALGTTDPNSVCYNCHKILTPLALQRNHWSDEGQFRTRDDQGLAIDATDQSVVPEYPFKGEGLEAFATQAVKKERFIRTMIDTHFHFYFGRPMRFRADERTLYKKLWDQLHAQGFTIRGLIRGLLNSPEYMEGHSPLSRQPAPEPPPTRRANLN